MLPLDRTTSDIVALSAAGAALLALLIALVAVTRWRALRRTLAVLEGDGRHESLLDLVSRQHQETAQLRELVATAEQRLAEVREAAADALRHVAVVRYDAFQDMGGRMSFSAALLDDSGDGIVLTAINGRSETRAYAKGVKAGESEQSMSPEERQAVDHALRGARRGAVPAGRSR